MCMMIAEQTKEEADAVQSSASELNQRTPSHVVRTFGKGNVKTQSTAEQKDLPSQDVFDLLDSSDEAGSSLEGPNEVIRLLQASICLLGSKLTWQVSAHDPFYHCSAEFEFSKS